MDIPKDWTRSHDGKAIEKRFVFTDFGEAFAFLTRLAMEGEKRDHHPEFTSRWNVVDVRLTSHDEDRVSERDLALARFIDTLSPGA